MRGSEGQLLRCKGSNGLLRGRARTSGMQQRRATLAGGAHRRAWGCGQCRCRQGTWPVPRHAHACGPAGSGAGQHGRLASGVTCANIRGLQASWPEHSMAVQSASFPCMIALLGLHSWPAFQSVLCGDTLAVPPLLPACLDVGHVLRRRAGQAGQGTGRQQHFCVQYWHGPPQQGSTPAGCGLRSFSSWACCWQRMPGIAHRQPGSPQLSECSGTGTWHSGVPILQLHSLKARALTTLQLQGRETNRRAC